ncbi:MAG: hypothetical protein JXR56_06845, partial [Candidatus Cloacimonetes bacterium]|nr:hypothetical protein [Candidatus Cloacimonadota bacterium]
MKKLFSLVFLCLVFMCAWAQHDIHYFSVNKTENTPELQTYLANIPFDYDPEEVDGTQNPFLLHYDNSNGEFSLHDFLLDYNNVNSTNFFAPTDMCIFHFYPTYDINGNPLPTILPYSLDFGTKFCITVKNVTNGVEEVGDPSLFIIDTGISALGVSAITKIQPSSSSTIPDSEQGCSWVDGFTIRRSNASSFVGLSNETAAGIYAENSMHVKNCVFGSVIDNENFYQAFRGQVHNQYSGGISLHLPIFEMKHCTIESASAINQYPLAFFSQQQNGQIARYTCFIFENEFYNNYFGAQLNDCETYYIADNIFENDPGMAHISSILSNAFYIRQASTENATAYYDLDSYKLDWLKSSILRNRILNVRKAIDVVSESVIDFEGNPSLIRGNIIRDCLQGIDLDYSIPGALISRNIIEISNNMEFNLNNENMYAFRRLSEQEKSDYLNNTLIHISNTDTAYLFDLNSIEGSKVINNLIWGFELNPLGDNDAEYSYCVSDIDFGGTSSMITTLQGNLNYIIPDPLQEENISDVYYLDDNYTLPWDETQKSVMINSGYNITHCLDEDDNEIPWYKDVVFDDECSNQLCSGECEFCYNDHRVVVDDFYPTTQDMDHSRKDIGAKPYLPMEDNEYVIENSVLELNKNQINWICLPGLDGLTTHDGQTPVDYTIAEYVFGDQSDLVNAQGVNVFWSWNPPYLDEIIWDWNGESGIDWNTQNLEWNNIDTEVTTPKGYKVRFLPAAPETVKIEFDGFKAGSTNNPDYEIEVFQPLENGDT